MISKQFDSISKLRSNIKSTINLFIVERNLLDIKIVKQANYIKEKKDNNNKKNI